MLRKQLNQIREELAQKEKYSKAQIDRLQRQVVDLRNENSELREEIAHYDEQLRNVRETAFEADYKKHQQQNTGIGTGILNRLGDKDKEVIKIENHERDSKASNT